MSVRSRTQPFQNFSTEDCVMSEFSEPLDFFGCSGSTKSERSDEREGRREDRRDDRSSTRPSLSHQVSDDGEACLACIHELRRTDALEQAISGATHDFNNMLGCVVAAVELIYKRIQRGQYTDLETLFEDVHRTCERSSLLASRLMDFSAPVGQYDPPWTSIRLSTTWLRSCAVRWAIWRYAGCISMSACHLYGATRMSWRMLC